MLGNGTMYAAMEQLDHAESRMTSQQLSNISESLGKLDAGQLHLIELFRTFSERALAMDDKLDTRTSDLQIRVDRLERQLADQERRAKPWRTFWLTIAASVIAAVVTYFAVGHIVITH